MLTDAGDSGETDCGCPILNCIGAHDNIILIQYWGFTTNFTYRKLFFKASKSQNQKYSRKCIFLYQNLQGILEVVVVDKLFVSIFLILEF